MLLYLRQARGSLLKQIHINANIWRFDLSQPQTPAQKVVASSRQQTAGKYSPDGTQIAFQSNRASSNYEVWVSVANPTPAASTIRADLMMGSAGLPPILDQHEVAGDLVNLGKEEPSAVRGQLKNKLQTVLNLARAFGGR